MYCIISKHERIYIYVHVFPSSHFGFHLLILCYNLIRHCIILYHIFIVIDYIIMSELNSQPFFQHIFFLLLPLLLLQIQRVVHVKWQRKQKLIDCDKRKICIIIPYAPILLCNQNINFPYLIFFFNFFSISLNTNQLRNVAFYLNCLL